MEPMKKILSIKPKKIRPVSFSFNGEIAHTISLVAFSNDNYAAIAIFSLAEPFRTEMEAISSIDRLAYTYANRFEERPTLRFLPISCKGITSAVLREEESYPLSLFLQKESGGMLIYRLDREDGDILSCFDITASRDITRYINHTRLYLSSLNPVVLGEWYKTTEGARFRTLASYSHHLGNLIMGTNVSGKNILLAQDSSDFTEYSFYYISPNALLRSNIFSFTGKIHSFAIIDKMRIFFIFQNEEKEYYTALISMKKLIFQRC